MAFCVKNGKEKVAWPNAKSRVGIGFKNVKNKMIRFDQVILEKVRNNHFS